MGERQETVVVHGAGTTPDGRIVAEIRLYPPGTEVPDEVWDAFLHRCELGVTFRPWFIESFGGRVGRREHNVECLPGAPCKRCTATALRWWAEWQNRWLETQERRAEENRAQMGLFGGEVSDD